MRFDYLRMLSYLDTNMCAKARLCIHTTHRVFHHRKEEKGSYVAKTVDVLVNCGEGLPQILRPLQH